MSPAVAQRSLLLAAVALLAAALALALSNGKRGSAAHGSTTPQAAPAAGGWYEAVAGPAAGGERTACGKPLTAATLGVAHPALPCGAKLEVAFGGRQVTTEVVDHGPVAAGRQFELTAALAKRLGLAGTQRIRWRYATGG